MVIFPKDENMQDDKRHSTQELRNTVRRAAAQGASIAFKPTGALLEYYFRLRDISDTGLGILVRKDSDIVHQIKVGDILAIKYHKGDATISPQSLRVEIKHISEPEKQIPENHYVVGLFILEKVLE